MFTIITRLFTKIILYFLCKINNGDDINFIGADNELHKFSNQNTVQDNDIYDFFM